MRNAAETLDGGLPSRLIDGELIGYGRSMLEVLNPATGEVLGELPCATANDIRLTLESSAKAFRNWRETSPQERGGIMSKAAVLFRERVDAIARVMTLEQGKPLKQSGIEVVLCAEIFDWFAAEAGRAYGRIIPSRRKGKPI